MEISHPRNIARNGKTAERFDKMSDNRDRNRFGRSKYIRLARKGYEMRSESISGSTCMIAVNIEAVYEIRLQNFAVDDFSQYTTF